MEMEMETRESRDKVFAKKTMEDTERSAATIKWVMVVSHVF